MLWLVILQAATASPPAPITDGIAGGKTSVQFEIHDTIPPVCSIDTQSDTIVLDVRDRDPQPGAVLTYVCNAAGGFTRTITSANNGALRRDNQSIPYFISQSGDSGLAITRTRLSSPLISLVPASEPLTRGVLGTLSIEIPAPAKDLLAGEYRDTITVEITPN